MGKKKRTLEASAEGPNPKPSVDNQSAVAASLYELPQHSRQASFSLLYLFVFSCMMFTLPFVSFFGTRHVLDTYFDVSAFQRTVYSVLAAVVTVNGIIVAYAALGYNEEEYDDQGNKIDQSVNKKSSLEAKKKPNNKKNKPKLI